MKFDKPVDEQIKLTVDVLELMPAHKDIPDNFENKDRWVEWQQKWFFSGLSKKDIPNPKPGIDIDKALKHLNAIQRSWAIKHEHKEAGVAYLASLWFE